MATVHDHSAAMPFFTTLQRMINDFCTIFPDCQKTRAKSEAFESWSTLGGIADSMVGIWHEKLHAVYDRCKEKDASVVDLMCGKIVLLREIDFIAKVPAFTEDDWSVFWSYVNTLNRYAAMYYNLPDGFTDMLMKAVPDAKPLIADNNLDDFKKIGQRIVDGLSEADRLTARKSLSSTFLMLGGMDGLRRRFS